MSKGNRISTGREFDFFQQIAMRQSYIRRLRTAIDSEVECIRQIAEFQEEMKARVILKFRHTELEGMIEIVRGEIHHWRLMQQTADPDELREAKDLLE